MPRTVAARRADRRQTISTRGPATNKAARPQQMKVIKQAVRAAQDVQPRRHHRQPREKAEVVVGVEKNILAVVATRHDVIENAGNMYTQRSGHSPRDRKVSAG